MDKVEFPEEETNDDRPTTTGLDVIMFAIGCATFCFVVWVIWG